MVYIPDFYLFYSIVFICSQLGNIGSPIGELIFHGWGTNIPQLGANKNFCITELNVAYEKVTSCLIRK